jgi:hypothetical protein
MKHLTKRNLSHSEGYIKCFIFILFFMVLNPLFSQNKGCEYTQQITYLPGTELNANGELELKLPRNKWTALGGTSSSTGRGSGTFSFIKFNGYIKRFSAIGDAGKTGRLYQVEFTNTSKFTVIMRLAWEGKAFGQYTLLPGKTIRAFDQSPYYKDDSNYPKFTIKGVQIKFTHDQKKIYGTYYSKYFDCNNTPDGVAKKILEEKKDDFWSGGKKTDNKKKVADNKNARDDFWNGIDASINKKKNTDNDFWKGKGTTSEEDYFKKNTTKPKSNQFIGEIESKTKYIKIICRDHGEEDGDRVSIRNNKQTIKSNLTLQNSSQTISIELKFGMNRIDFKALNQGSKGYNTAEFKVYDDRGKLISSKEWNILTGYTATLLIVKL